MWPAADTAFLNVKPIINAQNQLCEPKHFGIFRSDSDGELVREFGRSQQAEGMVGPDVVVVEERPLQSSVHFAGGRRGGRTI